MPSPPVVLLVVVSAVVAVPGARSFLSYGIRTKASEATISLTSIASVELDYFKQHGSFLAAGPSPRAAPKAQKQAFNADDGFRNLGWQPEGTVYHQYEVRLTGPKSALLIARGDIDANGKVAEYNLELTVDAPVGQVQYLTPGEY